MLRVCFTARGAGELHDVGRIMWNDLKCTQELTLEWIYQTLTLWHGPGLNFIDLCLKNLWTSFKNSLSKETNQFEGILVFLMMDQIKSQNYV